MQSRQFPPRKPADFICVAGCKKLPSDLAAEEINQDIVILHALLFIPQDAIVDAQQFARFDDEARLFASLTNGGLSHKFSNLKDSAGDRPLCLQRRMRTLDEQNPLAVDDDGADADQREFGEFTFHKSGIRFTAESRL